MYAAGYNIYIAGAISCDSSLMKVSLFGLEFMSTISVNPNRTYLSSFFIASSALETTTLSFPLRPFPLPVRFPLSCAGQESSPRKMPSPSPHASRLLIQAPFAYQDHTTQARTVPCQALQGLCRPSLPHL